MAGEKKPIYPMGVRQNYNSTLYSDIAIRNYTSAKQQFEELDFSLEGHEDSYPFDLFVEHCISTIVFSAMCIEAFLNDYAAACLGDDEFYGFFDKLSVDGKFALIAKFILTATIDKSKAYYYRLKRLIRDRNNYMHSKSTAFSNYQSFDGEEDAIAAFEYLVNHAKELEIDKTPYLELLDAAKNGLCAIRDIAFFFDENDSGINAIARLFGVGYFVSGESKADERKTVLHELQIKNTKETSTNAM